MQTRKLELQPYNFNAGVETGKQFAFEYGNYRLFVKANDGRIYLTKDRHPLMPKGVVASYMIDEDQIAHPIVNKFLGWQHLSHFAFFAPEYIKEWKPRREIKAHKDGRFITKTFKFTQQEADALAKAADKLKLNQTNTVHHLIKEFLREQN